MNDALQSIATALREELRLIVRAEVRALLNEISPTSPSASMEREYLTIQEAAEFCRLSESSIRRAIKSGEIHPTRHGRTVRFARRELLRWSSSANK